MIDKTSKFFNSYEFWALLNGTPVGLSAARMEGGDLVIERAHRVDEPTLFAHLAGRQQPEVAIVLRAHGRLRGFGVSYTSWTWRAIKALDASTDGVAIDSIVFHDVSYEETAVEFSQPAESFEGSDLLRAAVSALQKALDRADSAIWYLSRDADVKGGGHAYGALASAHAAAAKLAEFFRFTEPQTDAPTPSGEDTD